MTGKRVIKAAIGLWGLWLLGTVALAAPPVLGGKGFKPGCEVILFEDMPTEGLDLEDYSEENYQRVADWIDHRNEEEF